MINTQPTQNFVPIKEIRDGIVILKDGSFRAILMASTMNFALKSEDEQTAIVMQYQNFLNSLDFPVQFFVESRKLDIVPYLMNLRKLEKEQTNELLKVQTKEYIQFIKDFISMTSVVSKSFYAVVPYKPVFAVRKNLLASLGLGGGGTRGAGKNGDEQFEENKSQLQRRVDSVRQGLATAGIKTAPLNTEELVELFYKLFNPGELEKDVVSEGKELK